MIGGAVIGLLAQSGAGSSISLALVALATVAIIAWAFVDLGLLPGKEGLNRYIDPMAGEVAAFD